MLGEFRCTLKTNVVHFLLWFWLWSIHQITETWYSISVDRFLSFVKKNSSYLHFTVLLEHLSIVPHSKTCFKVCETQSPGPSFEMFLWWHLHVRPQSLNLVVSKCSPLLTSFCYFFFLFAPAFFLFFTFWVFEVFNLFTFLFPGSLLMETYPNFYSSIKVWGTVCANYSVFHIGSGVTPPQAVLQEGLKPPNVWELYKAKRQSQGYSPLQPMTIMLSSGCFYGNQYQRYFKAGS